MPWDGPAEQAAMPDNTETLRYCHAWVDSTKPSDQKGSYKDPHHVTKGGPANLPACRNGLARLSNTDIPEDDKAGVKAHLEAHLTDGNKKETQSSHPASGGQGQERTAAVPTTLEELETGARAELDAAQYRSTTAQNEIKAIIDLVEREKRPNLTVEEDTRVKALFATRDAASTEIKSIEARLANIGRLSAEVAETTQRMNRVEPTNTPRPPAYDEVARVTREERSYHTGNDRKGAMFLRDVLRKHFFNDHDANERLSRHMREESDLRSGYLTRAVGTGGFAGLVVPQYLTDMYAPATAALRPFADVCNHHDLPPDGMTVNIARITTPSQVALQTSENSAVANQDMNDTLLTENIQTAAGQQTVSRQAAERGIGIEEIVMDDLFRRYATDIDAALVNQATTGLAAVATNIQYDDASPSGLEFWPKLLSGAATTEANLLGFAQPDVVLMHSRRWYWLQSQLSSQWPMFGQPRIGENRFGENYAASYGRGARGVLPNGMIAVVDNNITTTYGSGTNQDQVFVVATDECHLWEDPAAPVYLRCEQPAAANLGVLMVLYGYFAYSFRRYPGAFSAINGTGLISPAF
jgi:hypothetical protein